MINIPKKYSDKVKTADAKNIGEDLEAIMKNFQAKGYEVKYNSWPMNVYGGDLGTDDYGNYVAGLGYMNLNAAILQNGYNSTYTGGADSLFSTHPPIRERIERLRNLL